MTTSIRSRVALAVAGLFAAVGALELMSDHEAEDGARLTETIDYALEWLFASASAGAAVALVSLGTTIGHRWGRVALIGSAAGNGALAIAAAVTAANGRESLDALFGVGILMLVAGYVTLATLDARRRIHPRRAGIALLVGYVAAVVTDVAGIGGGFMLAASWAAVSHLLVRGLDTAGLTADTDAVTVERG